MNDAIMNVPPNVSKMLLVFWGKVVSNAKGLNGKHSISLGYVSDKVNRKVNALYGKRVTRQTITVNDIIHIYREHGKNHAKELADDQIPVTGDNIVLIYDVLTDPDSIISGHKTRRQGYDTIMLSKEYADGTVHVTEAIIDGDTLKVHTVYIWNAVKTGRKKQALGI